MSEKGKSIGGIAEPALIVAAGTAVLYAAGWCYYAGYFLRLGIPTSTIAVSSQKYVLQGGELGVLFGLTMLMPLLYRKEIKGKLSCVFSDLALYLGLALAMAAVAVIPTPTIIINFVLLVPVVYLGWLVLKKNRARESLINELLDASGWENRGKAAIVVLILVVFSSLCIGAVGGRNLALLESVDIQFTDQETNMTHMGNGSWVMVLRDDGFVYLSEKDYSGGSRRVVTIPESRIALISYRVESSPWSLLP